MPSTLKSLIINERDGSGIQPWTKPTTGDGPPSLKRPLVYLRGSPPNIEICIAPGNHTCQSYPVSLEQLKNLVADGADSLRRWDDA